MRRAAAALSLLLLASPAAAQTAPAAAGSPAHPVAGTHICTGYYPDAERKLDHTGKVLVSYDVEADNTITNARLLQSSGFPALDAAALRCVLQSWRSIAATQGGVPVASRGHAAYIEFTLVDAPPPPAPPPTPDRAGEIYGLLGIIAAVAFAAIAFVARRRRRNTGAAPSSPDRGPVTCPACGTVNIAPVAPATCASCGQSLTLH